MTQKNIIFNVVKQNPGITQGDIISFLAVDDHTVRRNIKTLTDIGLLRFKIGKDKQKRLWIDRRRQK